MKATAVEWLVDKLSNYDSKMIELFDKEIEQAEEMEKQQKIDFAENYELYESDKYPRKTLEQYYDETFKTK